MDLMARRRVMLAAGKRPRLPSGYHEVAYIEFGNGRYIDTGIVSDGDVGFESIISTQIVRNTVFISENKNWSFGQFVFQSYGDDESRSHFIVFTGDTFLTTPVVVAKNYIYNAGYNGSAFRVDSYYQNVTFAFDGNTICIGQRDYYGGKHYYHKLYKIGDQKVVRELIPCYRDSDNKPGMYDLCGSICPLTNSPFYINAGAGEFIVGPDVN